MPTLLMITYHFPPSSSAGVFRLLGFARHLPQFGWNVAVVAPPGLPWEPSDPALLKLVPPETVVHSVPYPAKVPRVVRWLAADAVWLPYARRAARKAVRQQRPDVVLTSSPPHWVHLIGRHLQRRFKLPWVADFRDPWVTGSFGKMSAWQRHWQRRWEARVMRRADLVIHNTPCAALAVQKAYPQQAARMTYLTNGFDPERFPIAPAGQRGPGPVRILHAGELYMGRDPRPLFDAIASLPAGSVPPFQVEFMGRTNPTPSADPMAEARQRGIEDRVVWRPQVSYEQSLVEMSSADLLLLLEPPDRNLGVPAKLYEYIGAARPILAATGGSPDLEAILKESGVPYRLVGCQDVPAIRAALVELIGGVVSGSIPAPAEGREKFWRQTLTGRLAKMLDGVLQQRTELPS